VERLLDSFSRTSKSGIRNRAMVGLIYGIEMKVGQVIVMERRHYESGADTLVMPATSRTAERTVRVDRVTRGLLDEWLAVRRRIAPGPMAPFFCTIEKTHLGWPIQKSVLIDLLRSHGLKAGIEKRVNSESLRLSRRRERVVAQERMSAGLEAYLGRGRLRDPI
jgi:site-specific recombinase XerC